ncbi:MAG: hypothetical protein FJZ38_01025 [Candidatus Rokubacteria bacterium]|nr:hypothetical protein [Candidatus Rokubacteria bacterium]
MVRVEDLHPEVVRALRRLSGMERLRPAHEMWELTRDRLAAYFAARHPEWTRERIQKAVAQRLLHDASRAPSPSR